MQKNNFVSAQTETPTGEYFHSKPERRVLFICLANCKSEFILYRRAQGSRSLGFLIDVLKKQNIDFTYSALKIKSILCRLFAVFNL